MAAKKNKSNWFETFTSKATKATGRSKPLQNEVTVNIITTDFSLLLFLVFYCQQANGH